MSEKEDGGPAFPEVFTDTVERGDYRPEMYSAGLMSLMDYFAAKAMNGMFQGWPNDNDAGEIARRSYVLADAMLAQRGR